MSSNESVHLHGNKYRLMYYLGSPGKQSIGEREAETKRQRFVTGVHSGSHGG